jgi:hypothetical protein
MNSHAGFVHANNRFMPSRIAFSLVLTIAVVALPAAPIELTKAFSPKTSCSAHTKIARCQGCPMTPSSPSSGSGSTCCSAQAPCFVGYANSSEDFVAGVSRNDFTTSANDRVSARFQRPPVPPPRVAFS